LGTKVTVFLPFMRAFGSTSKVTGSEPRYAIRSLTIPSTQQPICRVLTAVFATGAALLY